MRYSYSLEAFNLGDLMRISVRTARKTEMFREETPPIALIFKGIWKREEMTKKRGGLSLDQRKRENHEINSTTFPF